MADYAAVLPTETGATSTARTGTASADTIPAGCVLLLINAGAGAHNVDLAISYTWHGLSPGATGAPGKRRIVVGTSSSSVVRVPVDLGDANGKVAVAIDGTPGEITYHVISA